MVSCNHHQPLSTIIYNHYIDIYIYTYIYLTIVHVYIYIILYIYSCSPPWVVLQPQFYGALEHPRILDAQAMQELGILNQVRPSKARRSGFRPLAVGESL